MKKTSHQIFIEKLHKQLIPNEEHRGDPSKSHNGSSDENACEEDIMSELEKKSDELFGSLDDDE